MDSDYDPECEVEVAMKPVAADRRAGAATLDQLGDSLAGTRPRALRAGSLGADVVAGIVVGNLRRLPTGEVAANFQ